MGIMSKLSTIVGGDETQELVYKSLPLFEPPHRIFTYTFSILILHKFCLNSPDAGSHTSQPFTNNPTQMQQSLDSSRSNTTSWYEGYYYGSPLYNRQVQYTGPVYRKIAVYSKIAPNQQLYNQYRAPKFKLGPKRNRRRKRFRKAGPQPPNHLIHEPSGAVFYGRSIGVNPGMTRNASNNPGGGKV